MKKQRPFFSNEVEIVEANVLEKDRIQHSFTGIDGVFISLPEQIVPAAMPIIIEAAKASKVKQLMYVSGCTVRKENALASHD